jgi:hypothetical protein
MFTPHLTDDQFDRYVLDILRRELDRPGLARYLRLHPSIPADHPAHQHTWLDTLTPEDRRRDSNSSQVAAPALKKAAR